MPTETARWPGVGRSAVPQPRDPSELGVLGYLEAGPGGRAGRRPETHGELPPGAPVRPRRAGLALERLAVRMECLGVQGTEDPRRGFLPREENRSPALLQRGCGRVGQAPSGSTQVESGRLGSAFRDLSSWSLGQGRLDAGSYPSGAIPRTPRACLASPLQAVPGPCPSFPADPAAGPPDVPALGAGLATHPGA